MKRVSEAANFLPTIGGTEPIKVRNRWWARVVKAKSQMQAVPLKMSKPDDMTQLEFEMFGNWELPGFSKIRILGKGGYAIVWLVKDNESGNHYAAKQFPWKSKSPGIEQSAKTEVEIHAWMRDVLQSNPNHPGVKLISMLIREIV